MAKWLDALRESVGTPEPAALAELQARIRAARDWQELEDVLADAQQAFVEGDVSGAEVEALAEGCIVRAREVPECSTC